VPSDSARAAMLSVLLFADDAGRVVLSRDYRGDIGRLRVADFCASQLRAGSGALARGDAPPVTLFDSSTFVVRRVRGAPGPLWLVGAANGNANAATCVELLSAFERLLHEYFGDETLSASAIRGQAALVFALLDEARRAAAAMPFRLGLTAAKRARRSQTTASRSCWSLPPCATWCRSRPPPAASGALRRPRMPQAL